MAQVACYAIKFSILALKDRMKTWGTLLVPVIYQVTSGAEKFASFGIHNARYIQPSEIVNQYSLKL